MSVADNKSEPSWTLSQRYSVQEGSDLLSAFLKEKLLTFPNEKRYVSERASKESEGSCMEKSVRGSLPTAARRFHRSR